MRTILVTGGTGDLGHAVVPRLAQQYRCLLTVRSERARVPAAENVDTIGLGDRIVEPLFALVSLAGAFAAGEDEATASRMLDANLVSFVRAWEMAAGALEDGGRIVAVSSAASVSLPAELAAYNASKAALNAYLETLSRKLRPRRIMVNALLPTALDTPPMRAAMDPAKLVPLARVTGWIEFLLSERGSGVTGQRLLLDA